MLEALRLPAAPQYRLLPSDCSLFGAEAVGFFLLRNGVAELGPRQNAITSSNEPSTLPLSNAKCQVLVAGMLLCGPWEQDLAVGNTRWENFKHKSSRELSCMWTSTLNSRVNCILWGICPAQVASSSKSGFYRKRTTRHLLWATTTNSLHIGAGGKWDINERNNFSHMAIWQSAFTF